MHQPRLITYSKALDTQRSLMLDILKELPKCSLPSHSTMVTLTQSLTFSSPVLQSLTWEIHQTLWCKKPQLFGNLFKEPWIDSVITLSEVIPHLKSIWKHSATSSDGCVQLSKISQTLVPAHGTTQQPPLLLMLESVAGPHSNKLYITVKSSKQVFSKTTITEVIKTTLLFTETESSQRFQSTVSLKFQLPSLSVDTTI